MRVHTGERELERRGSPARASLEERHPRTWRAPRVALVRVERGEEVAREDDVEPREAARVREGPARTLSLHPLSHLAIEPGEAGDAVVARQRRLESAQPGDDVGDGLRRDGSNSDHASRLEP